MMCLPSPASAARARAFHERPLALWLGRAAPHRDGVAGTPAAPVHRPPALDAAGGELRHRLRGAARRRRGAHLGLCRCTATCAMCSARTSACSARWPTRCWPPKAPTAAAAGAWCRPEPARAAARDRLGPAGASDRPSSTASVRGVTMPGAPQSPPGRPPRTLIRSWSPVAASPSPATRLLGPAARSPLTRQRGGWGLNLGLARRF